MIQENKITIRAKIKAFLQSILPKQVFYIVKKIYLILFSNFFNKKDAKIVEKYTEVFLNKYGKNVIDGPFKGMQYTDDSVGSSYLHKLAGFYEACLHAYIYEVQKLDIKNILDIGAAEGYYTTGFGKIFNNATVVAFELEQEGRERIKEMHAINNLNNKLTVLGEATSHNIVKYMSENTLLICDCEGAEKTILDIENKDQFKNIAFGIVELHDEIVEGCLNACEEYFRSTHHIEIVTFKHASKNDFVFLNDIHNKNELHVLLRERGIQDQKWMILRRR